MIKLDYLPDKAAIVLSLLCTIHCLAIPLALIAFPGMASLPFAMEGFELWMVLAALPISLYALAVGCRQHRRFYLLASSTVGLSLLLLDVCLPESMINETIGTSLSVAGAMLIVFGHYNNYRLCRHQADCTSPQRN